jgi:DNA modification methylase
LKIRDRILELRRVPASELKPNPKNWRTHPQAQADALRGVLAEVGIADAVLARELEDGSLMLLDGHLRVETMGDQVLPVLVLDVNEAEGDKVLATLDPLAAMAESDAAKLDAILREVDTGSPELQQMLADLAEEAGLYKDEEAKEVVEDEVPEPPADPMTKPGDLWILGDHRVLCGDSTKEEDVARLMNGVKVNVAFTSPPYASQRKYDESSGFKPIHPDKFVEWFADVQANVSRVLAADGSWIVNIKEHCDDGQRSLYVNDLTIAHVRTWGWRFVDELVWTHRGVPGSWPNRFKNAWEPVFHYSHSNTIKFHPENVSHESDDCFHEGGRVSDTNKTGNIGWSGSDISRLTGTARPSNVVDIPNNPANHQGASHSAAFPVGLPSFFIKAYSDKGDNVYEPFCGSGTTLIAAEQLGRKCFGMEISPQYCDVIVKRWETLTGKNAELDKPAKKPKSK